MSNENNNSEQKHPPEPSVLDFVKSLFRFGGERIQLQEFTEDQRSAIGDQQSTISNQLSEVSGQRLAASDQPQSEASQPFDQAQGKPSNLQPATPFPWRSLLALFLALLGQRLLEPPPTTVPLGGAFYIAALSALVWALYRREWTLAPLTSTSDGTDPLTYRRLPLLASIVLAFWAFAILQNNLFTTANVIIWLLAIFYFCRAFWLKNPARSSVFESIASFFKRKTWTFSVSRWMLLLLAATALVFFFRFTQTANVPPEPFSDHAEKILDVFDVSRGETHIFFIRNTGREGFQMYWTLFIANLFGTGLSFLSLKLGTAILGFLTLPFIYLLGKEIGGPRVGLIAFVLAGIAYWPNVISRIGLRFPLYPLFAAPTLLYLIRGLRTRNRNDFILSGLFLGLGLHGYSPMRIVPFVVIAAFVLYWMHSQSNGARRELIIWLVILGLTSVLVFLPLLRYWADNPNEFGFRALSRLGSVERSLSGPAYQIFASNVVKGLKMYNFDDGEIWVNSIPHRTALDIVTGALFVLGVALILIRYLRRRHWLDLFLLLSIPLLQLPSTLSLAFPGENPALNRAGGAYVPAFIISGMALDGLLTSLTGGKTRQVIKWLLAGILLFASARQNYVLVFDTFYKSFRQGAWNTSDMGKQIHEFEQTYGRTDTVWIVPFPYWVDTRLPAVWAGIPNRDMAMWRENLPGTVELSGPKMFMVKANLDDPNWNDQESLDVLISLYPSGQLHMFNSDIPNHDFWIFMVPEK